MNRPSLSNVVIGVALVALGATCAPSDTRVVTVTEPKIIRLPPKDFLRSRDSIPLETDGLRARLAGREEVVPRVIFRTDTLVSPPDTVIQVLRVDGDGSLTTGVLIVRDSTDMRAPEIHTGMELGACDDGWSWNAGQVVCDRARFGHIYGAVQLSLATDGAIQGWPPNLTQARFLPALLTYWEPSFRSPWRASLSLDSQGRAALGVTRGFRLF